jgi:hypothetical protein
MTLNASTYLTETYLHAWVKTVGSHMSVNFAWGTVADPFGRMRITCQKCRQTLTTEIPELPEKLDWEMQKFVGLHRHDPSKVEANIDVPIAPIVKSVTRVTADFKPTRVRKKEGRRFREAN